MGNGNKVEFLVAICALVSSLIAIWVAWDQSRVMRAQQDGMVYPVLQVDGFVSRKDDTTSMGLRLENSGVGPALIESVIATANGEPLASLEPYRDSLAPGYQISWAALGGRAVAPGNQLDAIRLEWDTEEISNSQLNTAAIAWGEIEFSVCYCSVFQKCWVTGASAMRATPVKRCTVAEGDIFEEFGMARVTPTPKEEAPQ